MNGPQNGAPARRGGILAWAKSHKGAAAAVAAVAGLGVFLLARSGSTSSSGASNPSDTTGAGANPATFPGTADYSGTYDAAMQGVSDALAQWTNSSSSSPGPTGGPPPTPTGGPPPKKGNPNAHSWTDTGQSWTAAQLARALGIPVSALRASDAAGAKGLANPNSVLSKGASYTYVQTPQQSAAGVKPKNPLKAFKPVRKTPVKA